MTVTTTTAVSGPYTPNGVTVTFPFSFTAPTADEVEVIRVVDGVEEVVSSSLYGVTLGVGSGGAVTFLIAPATGSGKLFVKLAPLFTQDIEFDQGRPWLAAPVEEGYDRAAARDQVLKNDLSRAVRVPLDPTDVVGQFPVVLPDGSVGFTEGMGTDSAMRSDLATANVSKGAALVATPQGSTIDRMTYPSASDLLASQKVAMGAGTPWRGGKFDYVEADAAAADHHVTTAGGVKHYLRRLQRIHIEALGGNPDALDNSAVIQRAFDLWLARMQSEEPCELVIDENYTFTSPILVNLTALAYVGGAVVGEGGRLISNLASAGTAFEIRCREQFRNLEFFNFNIRGSANDTVTMLVDAGVEADGDFFYGARFDKLVIENAPNVGLRMTGAYFEMQINDPFVICTGITAGKYAIHLDKSAGQNPSSIDIRGGSTRGGFHGLYDESGDCKVKGGTFIQSGAECVHFENNLGGGIVGAHVENAYYGGTGANRAGILMSGSGFIRDCYGVSSASLSKMDTVAQVFSSAQGVVVSNLNFAGDVTEALRVSTGGEAGLVVQGIAHEHITFQNGASDGRKVMIDGSDRTLRVEPATGSIDVDCRLYDAVDLALSGNVTLNLTNPVPDRPLRIMARQPNPGPTFTLGFSGTSVYCAGGLNTPAIDATANYLTAFSIKYTGGVFFQETPNVVCPVT